MSAAAICDAERVVATRAFEISSWSDLKESILLLVHAHYLYTLYDRRATPMILFGESRGEEE